MTRAEKYPDTSTFHYFNANPHNRFTTDCVIRAVSTASGVAYNDVVMDLAKIQCKTGFDPSEASTFGKYLESLGFEKCRQPRKSDGTKYTGKEFCELLQRSGNKDRIVANIGGHHAVAIVNGKVYDTWNSTKGCIGNYWIK